MYDDDLPEYNQHDHNGWALTSDGLQQAKETTRRHGAGELTGYAPQTQGSTLHGWYLIGTIALVATNTYLLPSDTAPINKL